MQTIGRHYNLPMLPKHLTSRISGHYYFELSWTVKPDQNLPETWSVCLNSFSMVVLITADVIPSRTTMWVAMAEWRCPYFYMLNPCAEEWAEATLFMRYFYIFLNVPETSNTKSWMYMPSFIHNYVTQFNGRVSVF